MKCVCPMGRDRICPDDCFIAIWHGLPDDQKTKERRRPIVGALAKQGYTQQAIALQLGVSQYTISKDLETLLTTNNVKGQGKDTLGRKKSTGRPKGTKKVRGETAKFAKAREIVRPLIEADEALKTAKLEREHNISKDTFERAALAEQARKEALADPIIRPSDLSLTAQEKLDTAIRQHKRKLDLEFEIRCRAEVRRWLNDVSLPQYAKELTELERSISNRKGVMDRITYRKILSCLHPDRVQDPELKKRFGEAFRLFTELEKRVLDEKQSPTQYRKMPKTVEELLKQRAEVQAANRAKRTSKSSPSVRR